VTPDEFADLSPGDRVWCLASIGVPYEVAKIDEARRRVHLTPHAALPGMFPIDLSAHAAWMLSTERWDQIWYWPDREGERFDEVVERFADAHAPGEIVQGYVVDTNVGSSGFLEPDPKLAMSFEIQPATPPIAQVRVRPVVETPEGWVKAGPKVPLRIGMTNYRWSLSFGDIVVNWTDFLRPADD